MLPINTPTKNEALRLLNEAVGRRERWLATAGAGGSPPLDDWYGPARTTVTYIFGEDSEQARRFGAIPFAPPFVTSSMDDDWASWWLNGVESAVRQLRELREVVRTFREDPAPSAASAGARRGGADVELDKFTFRRVWGWHHG